MKPQKSLITKVSKQLLSKQVPAMERFELHRAFEASYKVQRPSQGRRLAISDIHGCLRTFERLISTIGLTRKDQLFLLGDYVNKGKDGKGVVDLVIDLLSDGYNVFPLRGNHEQLLLDAALPPSDSRHVVFIGKKSGLLDNQSVIIPIYQNFLEKLPYFYELDKFYLVHAGINFAHPKPFEDLDSMLWLREPPADPKGLKTIIHGHVLSPLDLIIKSLDQKKRVIGIDNGCVYRAREGMGNLVCLNLDTFSLTIQQNID